MVFKRRINKMEYIATRKEEVLGIIKRYNAEQDLTFEKNGIEKDAILEKGEKITLYI